MSHRAILSDVPLSTSLNQLSHLGERLYWRLLSQTDNWGRLPGELVKIRDLCIPRLAVTDSELGSAIEELTIAGRIALYCIDGTWVCQIVDFDRHQPIANLKRGKSRWPAPPQSPALPPAPQTATVADIRTDNRHSDIGETVTKALQNHRSTKTETEDRREDVSLDSSDLPLGGGLPDFENGGTRKSCPDDRFGFAGHDLREVSKGLRGADAGTPAALASVLRGMPEAALATALEGLDARRGKDYLQPIRNEARWLVGTIQTMRLEGQYGPAPRRSA